MSGFIQIHRKILEWEWYNDKNVFRLFMHLLLHANYKDKRYRGVLLKSGSIMTGRKILAEQTGLSVQEVRTALAKLELTNEVTIKSTKQGTIIQLVNYTKYQVSNQQINQRATNEQPTSNQRATTNNKGNKENKENNIFRQFDHLKITTEENNKLLVDWNANQINNILDSIENYKNNTSYKSLYLTARKWLNKQYPINNKLEETEAERCKRVAKEIEQHF